MILIVLRDLSIAVPEGWEWLQVLFGLAWITFWLWQIIKGRRGRRG